MVANPIPVVSPQFCSPSPVDLFKRTKGDFVVTDVKGNIIFKVKEKLISLRQRRTLCDASDKPLVTMEQKILSAHSRWKAYKGDSRKDTNLLFTVKRSSWLQFKTTLDVFLAGNTKEDKCDFRIKGSWSERSCKIYSGNSSNIVAQMHKKYSVKSVLLGKDTFSVTVYPHFDYAFVVSLIVILNEINKEGSGSRSGSRSRSNVSMSQSSASDVGMHM